MAQRTRTRRTEKASARRRHVVGSLPSSRGARPFRWGVTDLVSEFGYPGTPPTLCAGRGLHAPPLEEGARKRLVSLTDDQIALLKAALAHRERATADTSYDPQVQEWARTHPTETRKRTAAVALALAASQPESDW